ARRCAGRPRPQASAARPLCESASSAAEDLGFLGCELLLGEDAAVSQLGELGELLDRVGGRWRRRGLLDVRGGLLDVLWLFVVRGWVLRGPALRLPAGDAVAHGGCGAGNDGRAGHSTNESWHRKSPFLSGFGFQRIKLSEDRLDRDATARDELAAGPPRRH